MSWKHVKTPHLPEGRVGLAAIGERYRGRLAAALEKHGADALWLPDAPGADGRLAGHADLSMLHLGGGRLLSACGAGINARLEALGFDVIEVPGPGAAYPGDCALNACIAGGRLFHRLDITAKAALDAFPPEARVNIAQGYAKCCTSVADERSILSSDRGIALAADEIFISDGAKSDVGNILDLFDVDNTVLVPDPVYPVYVDTNVMAGRRILFADATRANGFLPMPDEGTEADIIYICSPNNPTGAAYSVEQLQAWVDYANARGAIILYDAAYERFVAGEGLARSIFETKGAEGCAIEFCSLSKTAGFTGTRCGYTVVPHALVRGGVHCNKLWLRRQTTKFNGVSYIVQRGAEAVFTEEGRKQIEANLAVYRRNAQRLAACLDELGVFYTGGKNSPYLWLECPGFADSWKFFDYLLEEANVVGTPGSGFGKNGEGFFRLTAFASEEATEEAAERILALFRK